MTLGLILGFAAGIPVGAYSTARFMGKNWDRMKATVARKQKDRRN